MCDGDCEKGVGKENWVKKLSIHIHERDMGKLIILFFWWFIVVTKGGYGTGSAISTVGPFDTLDQCKSMAEKVKSGTKGYKPIDVYDCWETKNKE